MSCQLSLTSVPNKIYHPSRVKKSVIFYIKINSKYSFNLQIASTNTNPNIRLSTNFQEYFESFFVQELYLHTYISTNKTNIQQIKFVISLFNLLLDF